MNKHKKMMQSLAATIITVGSLSGAANAGEIENSALHEITEITNLAQGNWLVGFSGSYTRVSADGASANLLYADVDFSYFFHDNWSVGASTFGILVPEGGEVDDTGYAIGLEPNLRYYFQNNSKYTPYLGAHVGFAYGKVADESDSINTYGAHAGVLFPLNEGAFFDVKLKWTEYDLPSSADIDLDTLQLLIGFKIKF